MNNLMNTLAVDPTQLGQTSQTSSKIPDANLALSSPQVAKIALDSQNAQLSLYEKLNTQAMTCTGKTVDSIPLDVRFVQTSENPFIQADVSNAGATDETIIIGSVLSQAGSAPFYKQTASAADAATVSDQNGANIRFLQGFGNLVCFSPVVVNIIQMISDDTTQRNQPFKYFDLAYDNTVNGITNNTTSTFTRFDTDKDVIKLSGVWSLGPQTFLSVLSKAGKDMTLIFSIAGMATVRSFKGTNG